ncbi:MAG: type III-B CRISPR module-associated protein Cmr5 [Anaerolineales bacterium]|nr:type III-B CRISPR module-associated protein Cmr5 [Anaerolineales bacterium]
MSNRKTTEQERAHHAWDRVEEVDKKGDSVKQNYGSWARKLPAMIQTNGLAQTMAFLCAKGKDHHKLLYEHVSGWVLRADTQKKLLPLLLEEDSSSYRRRTTEAIAYSLWLRRFAEGKNWGSAQGAED